MSRKKRRFRREKDLSVDKTKSRGLCQNCDNMDPEAFEYELFCAIRKTVPPGTSAIVVKAIRLFAAKTCRVCEKATPTIEITALEKAIGNS